LHLSRSPISNGGVNKRERPIRQAVPNLIVVNESPGTRVKTLPVATGRLGSGAAVRSAVDTWMKPGKARLQIEYRWHGIFEPEVVVERAIE
jgi:hypothetical protein